MGLLLFTELGKIIEVRQTTSMVHAMFQRSESGTLVELPVSILEPVYGTGSILTLDKQGK